ncbi:LptF/LptG family permease [Deferribacterales bacterium Es71-Z0220]|uniref:LptF/LptG family permease n=1 Tax=Deferrivibrio essentukiensis TaxID=2880922 RepID=UPI001F613555|nr:LptF/LptG family permease [Deferrivibrio essentukiensis]MCB4204284.1 LptF/LptG family permease [Deferrivibrio essentukiensis]
MNPFYKYVFKKFLYNLLVVLAFVLLLYTFFNVIQHTKYIERYNVNIFQIIYFDLLKIPYSTYQIMPIAVIISTVLTFVLLVKSNEMTGFVSIGGRTRNLSTMVVLLGLILSIATFFIGEIVSPKIELFRQKYKTEEFEKRRFVDYSKFENIWIKDNNKITYIKLLDAVNNSFIQMREYYLNDFKIIKIVEISSGKKSGKKWQLSDIKEYDLTDVPKKVNSNASKIEENKLLSELSQFDIDNPKLLSFSEISKYISVYKSKGLSTTQYEIILYNKLAHPLSIMVIILTILPVCMSFSRQYSYIKIVSKSLSLGGFYWILSASLISISKAGTLSPLIANFLPIILFTVIGFTLIFLKERGF